MGSWSITTYAWASGVFSGVRRIEAEGFGGEIVAGAFIGARPAAAADPHVFAFPAFALIPGVIP